METPGSATCSALAVLGAWEGGKETMLLTPTEILYPWERVSGILPHTTSRKPQRMGEISRPQEAICKFLLRLVYSISCTVKRSLIISLHIRSM